MQRVIAGLSLATFLGGCASVLDPIETPGPPELDAHWTAEPSEYVSADSIEDEWQWWLSFGDDTLTALVERAYDENLTLRAAAIRILEARTLLGIAKSELYPNVDSSSGVSRRGLSGNANLADDTFTDYRSSIDTSWELDIWGRVQRGVEGANADLNSLDAAYEAAALSLSAEVASVYVQYRVLQRRIELAEQNIILQEESLRIARGLLEDGSRTAVDVEQALAILSDTKALVPSLERSRIQARNALITLLTLTPVQLADWLPDERYPIPTIAEPIPMGVPMDLLRRRPDLRQAEYAAVAASARTGVAQADRYPRVTLLGSLGLEVTDGIATIAGGGVGDFFDGNSVAFNIGPSVTIPLFDGNRRNNRWLAQDAVFQQSVELYRLAVLGAVQDVENSLNALSQSSERYKHLSDSAGAYQRALSKAQVLYEAGETGFQIIVDSQRQLVVQQQAQVLEEGNISQAQIALVRALGGGWSRADVDRIPEGTRQELLERNQRWRDKLD